MEGFQEIASAYRPSMIEPTPLIRETEVALPVQFFNVKNCQRR
jgi:hypothetical protein